MNGPEETGNREQGIGNSEQDVQMMEFEQALSRAMQRVEVRAETTAKFLALAEEAERKRVHSGSGLRLMKLPGFTGTAGRVFAMPRIPPAKAWMGGAIAAALAVGVFAGAHIHTEHERRVQAQQQFEAAERITDQAMERTREQLRAQGIYLDQ
jgi:hypothetical protein